MSFDGIRERWLPAIEECIGSSYPPEGLLTEMVRFHMRTGGKRLRALLPVWICHNLGGPVADAVGVGAGFELLHNATLVHDDLQDGDEVRRGSPTIWKRWGEAQAINAGDVLYFQGLSLILRAAEGGRCAEIACQALTRVIEGQTMEFQLQLPADSADRIPPTLSGWERMARGKTAALFGGCMGAGAVVAHADEDTVAEAAAYGEELGLLFQVQDDFLDLVGDKGRDQQATDLAEGKLSFPVVWALENGSPAAAARLREIVEAPRSKTTPELIAEGLNLLEATGALKGTAAWLETAGQAALDHPMARIVPGFADRILAPVASVLGELRSQATTSGSTTGARP